MSPTPSLCAWTTLSLLALAAFAACDEDRRTGHLADASGGDVGAPDACGPDTSAPDACDPDPACTGLLTVTAATQPDAQACMEQLWVAPQAEATCAALATCACPGLPDDCLDRIAAPLREQIATALRNFAHDQATLDLDALRACVTARNADLANCHRERPSFAVTAACASAVLTDVPIGATCTQYACANGDGFCDPILARCEPLADLGAECAGGCREGLCRNDGTTNRCLLPRGDGAPCEDDGACDDGLRCIDATCEPPRAADAPCNADRDCRYAHRCEVDRCVPTDACTPGSDTCGDGGTCLVLHGTRLCVARALGDPCEHAEECPAGAWCADNRCAIAAPQGDPCSDGVYCAAGLACSFGDFTCQPIPRDGQPCALGVFGPSLCAEGLACLAGTCGPLPALGAACAIDNRCAPGLGCDFQPSGSVCVHPSTDGGPCTNDTVCAPDLYCDFGDLTCHPFVPSGGPCTDGNECGPAGTCAPDGHGAFACTHLPTTGESCFLECADVAACVTTELVTACAPRLCAALPPEP